MKSATVLLVFLICVMTFSRKNTVVEAPKYCLKTKSASEEIKKEIQRAQEKIKIIKVIKKDMDEKEWKIEL